MSGWFSKAKNSLSRAEPEKPQPFQVSCECGQSHAGLRRQRHQRLICKVCGRALFILPRDVYPQPQAKPPKATKKQHSPDDLTEPNLISIARLKKRTKGKSTTGESSPQPEAVPPAEPQELLAEKAAASPGKKRVQSVKKTTAPSKKIVRRDSSASRFWGPFRLIALAVACVGLFTTLWMVRQSRLSHAVTIVRTNGEQGLELIEQAEWSSARKELELASAALDLLGRTDPQAQTLRQYYRETRALTNLCSESIDEMLAEAVKSYEKLEPRDQRRAVLGTKYRGQWVVLEGVVRDATPSKSRYRVSEMPLPGMDSTRRAVIQIRSPLFARLVPAEGERSVIFAGEIAGIRHEEEGNRWVVQLDPDTVFLWTHLKTYLAAGFELSPARTEQEVSRQLAVQAQVAGEAP